MAITPARELTQAEKDRLVTEAVKNLPKVTPASLFASLVAEKSLQVSWDAPQQAISADLAARQLIVAKAVSELAKEVQRITETLAAVPQVINEAIAEAKPKKKARQ